VFEIGAGVPALERKRSGVRSPAWFGFLKGWGRGREETCNRILPLCELMADGGWRVRKGSQ
jgi:hypothetical protein